MAKTYTTRAFGGEVAFAVPVHDKTATAKVNGVTATIASQSEMRVQLTNPVNQGDLVEITYNPIDQYGDGRTEQFTPTTGQTISPTASCGVAQVTPAGTLAALTINFPSNPTRRSVFIVKVSQTITAVTWGNGTVLGAPSTLAANTQVTFGYSELTGKWYKQS